MNKSYRKVAETTVTKRTVKVKMSPQKLDAPGNMELEENGGLFRTIYDVDIEPFERTMKVAVRPNGWVVMVPARRSPSRATEIAKTPHGKVSQKECGDVVVNFHFSRSLVGNIAPTLCREAGKMLNDIDLCEHS